MSETDRTNRSASRDQCGLYVGLFLQCLWCSLIVIACHNSFKIWSSDSQVVRVFFFQVLWHRLLVGTELYLLHNYPLTDIFDSVWRLSAFRRRLEKFLAANIRNVASKFRKTLAFFLELRTENTKCPSWRLQFFKNLQLWQAFMDNRSWLPMSLVTRLCLLWSLLTTIQGIDVGHPEPAAIKPSVTGCFFLMKFATRYDALTEFSGLAFKPLSSSIDTLALSH